MTPPWSPGQWALKERRVGVGGGSGGRGGVGERRGGEEPESKQPCLQAPRGISRSTCRERKVIDEYKECHFSRVAGDPPTFGALAQF